jgi:hypothetical protein
MVPPGAPSFAVVLPHAHGGLPAGRAGLRPPAGLFPRTGSAPTRQLWLRPVVAASTPSPTKIVPET